MEIKKIKIGEDDVLQCPHCDGDYLHHGNVNVYSRYHEDDERTMHTEVSWQETKTAMVESNTVPNPSRRRSGMRISFECELCAKESTLAIAQHKGRTFIDWEIS